MATQERRALSQAGCGLVRHFNETMKGGYLQQVKGIGKAKEREELKIQVVHIKDVQGCGGEAMRQRSLKTKDGAE